MLVMYLKQLEQGETMTKDEALKLALSALNEVRQETFRLMRDGQTLYAEKKVWEAIYTIKKVLAQPEITTGNILMDSYNAMQSMKVEGPRHVVCQCDKCKAQQEQEPVAWEQFHEHMAGPNYVAPQRTWVGLTDEETETLIHRFDGDPHTLLDEVNARLKEKNNG